MKSGETKVELCRKELKKHREYNKNVQHRCNRSPRASGQREWTKDSI